jgi:flagellar assembly factor FliW
MAVTIDSTRFGAIEVPDEAVLEFPTGLIGLGGRRYALLHREESTPFVWLHSLDDPSLAIPITKPGLFFSDYEVELSDSEAERIGLTDPAQADVYVTVRAAEAIEDFRANLRAPIVVVNGRGHQVINEAEGTSVRAPLFSGVAVEQQVA